MASDIRYVLRLKGRHRRGLWIGERWSELERQAGKCFAFAQAMQPAKRCKNPGAGHLRRTRSSWPCGHLLSDSSAHTRHAMWLLVWLPHVREASSLHPTTSQLTSRGGASAASSFLSMRRVADKGHRRRRGRLRFDRLPVPRETQGHTKEAQGARGDTRR